MPRYISETQFYADQIDQMDLALDQLALKDRNYDRFALLLIDNVVELGLHRLATYKQISASRKQLDLEAATKAMGWGFNIKVDFAKEQGILSAEESESIRRLHEFRNTAYHAGLRHDEVLHPLAIFYFRITCSLMERVMKQHDRWNSYKDQLPHRALKYLGLVEPKNGWPPPIPEPFKTAWRRLDEVAASLGDSIIPTLHSDLKELVEEADRDLTFLAEQDWQRRSRKEAIIWVQVTKNWSDPEIQELIKQQFPAAAGAKMETITIDTKQKWLAENHNWPVKTDPMMSWKGQLDSLAKDKSNHAALRRYTNFLNQYQRLAENISMAATELEMRLEANADDARHDYYTDGVGEKIDHQPE